MVETVSTSPKSYLTGDYDYDVGYFMNVRSYLSDTIMTRDILQRRLKPFFCPGKYYRVVDKKKGYL